MRDAADSTDGNYMELAGAFQKAHGKKAKGPSEKSKNEAHGAPEKKRSSAPTKAEIRKKKEKQKGPLEVYFFDLWLAKSNIGGGNNE